MLVPLAQSLSFSQSVQRSGELINNYKALMSPFHIKLFSLFVFCFECRVINRSFIPFLHNLCFFSVSLIWLCQLFIWFINYQRLGISKLFLLLKLFFFHTFHHHIWSGCEPFASFPPIYITMHNFFHRTPLETLAF